MTNRFVNTYYDAKVLNDKVATFLNNIKLFKRTNKTLENAEKV